MVRENIRVTAQRMKANYDKTANYVPFQVVDKVWLFTPLRIKGKCPKIMSDWTGPWIILNILNDCVVRIQSEECPSKLQIVNVDRLAPHYCGNL